ncbi:hypothetical protein SCLCIDRAFT_1182975 [Scleroderma citrinum Foug A]|uniref:Uncharacterized protein n=1 Tax=Scleroderma citrinum Foug A TaxID=1036808 RepID=A0A0C3DXE4_9AGAM|nr:hypothetical protein SCLCIDRAFT_1182975 [Scleroderma citrinum Foug A]
MSCSAMLWLYAESWPDLLHPFASVIDSPELEDPGEMVITHADSKLDYVWLPKGPKVYQQYSPGSIEEWHKKHGKFME